MIDIRNHGGVFSGSRLAGVALTGGILRNDYTNAIGSYPRQRAGKDTFYHRFDNRDWNIIDLKTGNKIATYIDNDLDGPYPTTDELDDNCYGYIHSTSNSKYFLGAVNRSLSRVWSSATIIGSPTTIVIKDFLFCVMGNNRIVKLDRKTGAILQDITPPVTFALPYGKLGTNKTKDKLYFITQNGFIYIFNISDLSFIRSIASNSSIIPDGNYWVYGVAEVDNILYVFRGYASTGKVTLFIVDIAGGTFNIMQSIELGGQYINNDSSEPNVVRSLRNGSVFVNLRNAPTIISYKRGERGLSQQVLISGAGADVNNSSYGMISTGSKIEVGSVRL